MTETTAQVAGEIAKAVARGFFHKTGDWDAKVTIKRGPNHLAAAVRGMNCSGEIRLRINNGPLHILNPGASRDLWDKIGFAALLPDDERRI